MVSRRRRPPIGGGGSGFRGGDRVWLDLDELYPPPHRQPNTVFKSMAIAFRAMGAGIDYVDLMGISAAAFRIQVGGSLCPSSPHPHLGFACDALAQEALGFGFREYEWDPGRPETVSAARKAVVASIDRAAPVLTDDEEAGLAVGYGRGGDEAANPNLGRAATLYEEMADKVGTGWDHVPWPWQLESPSEWTIARRRRQASVLEGIQAIERDAIAELEAALKAAAATAPGAR